MEHIKILIIEDDPNIRENLGELLTIKGFTVCLAANGREGILQATLEKPDLIFCDITMPEINGYEVLKFVRENIELTLTPFIFLTAKTNSIDIRTGMNLGADDYLTKPFTINDLMAAINTRLEHKIKNDELINNKVNSFHAIVNRTAMHEFNTPLNGIIMGSELILNYFDNLSKNTILELIKIINQSSNRLHRTVLNNTLFAELLSIENDVEKKKRFSEGHCPSIAPVIEKKVLEKTTAANRSDDLIINLEDAAVSISPDNVERIIDEIVDNAIKFSPAGKKIQVTGVVSESFYSINIVDCGPGMAQIDASMIVPFKKLNVSSITVEGSGLGLYLAKRLIELNNGKLNFSPNKPEGLQVKIQFTIKQKKI